MNGDNKKEISNVNDQRTVNNHKTLAILTSGGDAPGMNPAIRAIVGCWLAQDKDNKIIAFKGGYNGVCRDKKIFPDRDYVAGLSARGGTIIAAGRCEGLKTRDSPERKAVRDVLTGIDDLAGVVVIGGDGSFRGMVDVIELECGIQAIGIPATIDNDIWRTDLSLGADTALNTAAEIIDKIRDTAAAFRRAFVVEIMGRECGYLALATALATEAEAVFLPEDEPGFDELGDIQRKLDQLYRMDALNSVIIAAEGSKINISTIQNIMGTYTNWEVRSVVPGYAQRGGRPSAIDRIQGCRFAVVMKNNSIKPIPLDSIINISQDDALEYERRMKELADIHCKLEKSDTLMAEKWKDLQVLREGSGCRGRVKTIDLWKSFWNARP